MYDLGTLFPMHEFSCPKIEVFTVYIEKQILEAICAPLNSGAKLRTTMRFFSPASSLLSKSYTIVI